MPSVKPFVGLMYDPSIVGPIESVTAPPYDVIDEPARARYLSGSPYSVTHLDLAEGAGGYARAAQDLRRWRREGALREVGPCWFAYEMRTPAGEVIRGSICALSLEELGDGVVPHEEVMEGPVRDRLLLLEAARIHPSAIYGTVEGADRSFTETLEESSHQEPLAEATDEEGVRHRVWQIPAEKPIDRWLSDKPLLIADGHHRYSTALLFREKLRRELGPLPGPWDQIPCLVVDEHAFAPKVLPYHRLLTHLTPGASSSQAHPATNRLELEEILVAIDDDEPSVGEIRAGGSRLVLKLDGDPPAVIALHATELRGVDAGRLRYTPSASAADRIVARGDAQVAYILPPTTPTRIREVLRSGRRLPQKSTFFWPKPRTGIVMMSIEGSNEPGELTPEADRAS